MQLKSFLQNEVVNFLHLVIMNLSARALIKLIFVFKASSRFFF